MQSISILKFIYLGEAKLNDKRINEFLTVAKNLDNRDLIKGFEDKYFADVNNENSCMQTEKFPTESKDVKEERTLDDQHRGHYKTGYKFECQECDKAYSKDAHLKAHIQSAHEGVRYACNQCEKQFTHESALTRHIQSVHEGVKYVCNQCGKQYTTQSDLTRHIQSVHEGVKYKYACNQCDHQFRRQIRLTAHIKSRHEGV